MTNCPAAQPCPRDDCPGMNGTEFCRWYARYRDWAAKPRDEQEAELTAASTDGTVTAELLAAVAACPDRGSVLPVVLQPECGCGGELTECRAGRGATPGRVTLAECLDCRRAELGPADR